MSYNILKTFEESQQSPKKQSDLPRFNTDNERENYLNSSSNKELDSNPEYWGSAKKYAGNYIGQSQYDTGITPETVSNIDELRALRQGALNKLGRGLVNATTGLLFDTIKDASYLLDFEQAVNLAKGTETEFSNWMADLVDKAKDSTHLDIYRTKESLGFHPESSGWWADAMPSIVSGLSMIIPAQLATKGLGVAGKLMGGKKLLSALGIGTEALEGITGASISRYMENTMEGFQTFQDTYKQAVDKGASEEKAVKTAGEAARNNWELNSVMLLQDIPQYLMLFKGFKGASKLFSKEGLKDIGKSFGSEMGEELYQYTTDKESRRKALINNHLTPDDNTTFTERMLDYSKDGEFWTSGVLGGIGGGIFAAHAVKSNQKVQEQFTGLLTAYKGALTNDKETYNRGQDIISNKLIIDATANNSLNKLKDDIQTIATNPQRIEDTEEKEEILSNSRKILNNIDYAENIQKSVIQEDISPDIKKLKFTTLLNQKTAQDRLREIDSKLGNLIAEDYSSTNLPLDVLEYKKTKLAIEGLKDVPNMQNRVEKLQKNLKSVEKEIIKENNYKDLSDLEKSITSINDSELKKLLANKEIESSIIDQAKDILYKINKGETKEFQDKINENKAKEEQNTENQRKQEETKPISSTPVETQETSELEDPNTEDYYSEYFNTIDKKYPDYDLSETKEVLEDNKFYIVDKNGKRIPPIILDDLKKIRSKLDKKYFENELETKSPIDQNKQEVLTNTQSNNQFQKEEIYHINEDQNVINARFIPDLYDLGESGKKKISPFTIDGGKDDGSDESANRYYRFVENNFPLDSKNIIVTKKNNPKLFNEILELDKNAKKFVEDNPEHEGIWIVIGDKNGIPIRANKDGKIDKNGDLIFGTVSTIEAIGNRITGKTPEMLQELTKQLTKFREDALKSTEPVYVYITDKSNGHPVFEKTKNGIRQSYNVIGRIADTIQEINLELPTLTSKITNKAYLSNGQAVDSGKLYGYSKDKPAVDLIPRTLTEQEQEKVFDLILQKVGVKERQLFNISEELNKLIYFNVPTKGPNKNTLGQVWKEGGYEKSIIFIGENRENKETLSTEEGQQRLRDFLKTKRININSRYKFNDKFTDIFGQEHTSYKDYILASENPLVGTDLVKNTEVQFRNQYFTYDSTLKTNELSDKNIKKESEISSKKSFKSFEPKTRESLDRLASKQSPDKTTKEEHEWFKRNFPNIPVEIVQGLIDNKSFGRFLASGKVLLSTEATPGTLYHEAFHVISQLYLTPKERKILYDETKEKADFKGKEKNDLNSEEILSEEFIEYKKSGKTVGGRYARNDFFRKILNFIKDLLNLPVSSIEDIYRRLDKGYYKTKNTKQNINFKSLDRSKVSIDKGVAFEKEVLDNIGALYYSTLFTNGKTIADIDTKISNALVNNIYEDIREERNKLIEQYNKTEDLKELSDLENKINNQGYILENWEDIIKLFLEKSKIKNVKIEIVSDDELDETQSINKEENKESNDTAYQEANLTSPKSLMNDSVWKLITSLRQKNKDGSDKLSENTGLPITVNPQKTYNFLLKHLAGLSSYEEIYEKLDSLAFKYPDLIDLADNLGEPSAINSYNKQLLQLQFRQDFAKNRTTSFKTIIKEDGTVYIVDSNNENNRGRIVEKWQNNIYSKSRQENSGKIVINTDNIQFNDYLSFLRSIGFTISPETAEEVKGSIEFKNAVIALQNYIIDHKGDITNLFIPTKEQKDKKTDVLGNINYLAELEANYNPEAAELSFISTEDKTVYSIGNNNNLSTVINAINNAKTKDELFQKYPHLNTVSTEGSVWLNELFDSKGNREKDKKISLNLHDGLAADSEAEDDFKKSTKKLTSGDKWVQEINSILLNGRSSFIRASDKSSEFTINLNTNGKNKPLIPIDKLTSIDNNELKQIFRGYFKSELKRIALHKVLGIGTDIDVFNKTGSKFTVFENILSENTKKDVNKILEDLREQDLTEDQLLKEIDSKVTSLYDNVDSDVITFFKKYSDEIQNDLKEQNIEKNTGLSKEFNKYSLEQLANTIAVNDYINSVEQTKLFIGDMAFYKDLFKRTSALTGTKETAANSPSINGWLNNNFKRDDNKVEDGKIYVVIFNDVKQSIAEDVLNSYKEILKGSGFQDSEINSIIKPYTSMDEGDAQGGIALDEYRSFMTRLGKPIPQDVFEKAKKGETLNKDELYYFTVIKPQYSGPQQYNNLFVPAFHKFSLLPLLPSMIKGKNMENILKTMTEKQVGYALFKSGSKVGTPVNKQGKANNFYTDGNSGKINTKNWQIQTVFYDFLGLQTKTSDPKNENIFGTQFKKLIFINQFNEGKEVIKGSKKLLDKFNSIIDDLVQKEKNKLIEELGINKTTLKSEDISKILDLLQEEAKNRDLPDNLIDGLQSEYIDGKKLLKYKFDAMVTKNKIDSMLTSIVNSRLIRQKITGDALVQVSSSGMESSGDRKVGTNPDLLFYRKDKNGKILPAQVKLAMSDKFKHLLDKFGSLDKLNEAIKNGKIDNHDLQIIAYRIPTQGFNSIEFFEINEFLPEESSTAIIVPTEIVAKSGSDFDIDKLNVITRSKKSSDLMDIATEILSNPDNFESLITPNSNLILKSLANEIQFINYLNRKPDPELNRENYKTEEEYQEVYNKKRDKYIKEREIELENNIRYTNQLKLSGKEGKISQFTKFMTAKGMVGITAIHNTHNVLYQIYNLSVNGKLAKINLPHNKTEDGNISLSKLKDSENKHNISEVISQAITSTVDAAKDPFLFDINITLETLPTALYLIRGGVPFETVGYFLSQPIIKEYTSELAKNKSGFLTITKNSKSKKKIKEEITKKYGTLPKDYTPVLLSEKDLKNNLHKNQNKDFNIQQLQILNDYLRYKEDSQSLSDAMKATNMDTAGIGKNLNVIKDKLKFTEKVKKDNFIKGIDSILNDSIVKTFNQLQFTSDAYSQFYYTQSGELEKIKMELIKHINPFTEKDKDKLFTLIENDLINFIVQNYGYKNPEKIQEELFKTDPIAVKLLDLKNKQDKTEKELKISKNLIIKELQSLLATNKRDTNNIKLYSKRLDKFTSDQLTESFRELIEIDPDLAKQIMDLGIIQSGLNNSPITYVGLIPYEYYNDLTKKAFEKFESLSSEDKKNGVDKFKRLFFKNNGSYETQQGNLKQGKPILGNGMYGKDYIIRIQKEKIEKPEKEERPQLSKKQESRINEDLRQSVISKFHSTKEQAETALREIKNLLQGSYIHQVGDKWKVYTPVQKEKSNQFPQQSQYQSESENISIEAFKEIADKLQSKFQEKINYKIVSPEEALNILESLGLDAQKYGYDKDTVPAFYDNKGTIIYPDNYLTTEVAFHEFAHPFVDAILEQNRALFLNLKRQLQDNESGKNLIKEIKKKYSWLVEKDQLTDKGWKEVITTALGRLAEGNLEESKDKGLIQALKQLLKRIGEYLQSLFSDPNKVIKPIEITPTTTLEELASLLNLENKIDLARQKEEKINYNLKSVEFLASEKATQLFNKFFNTNKDKFYQEITQFIGKDQTELIKDIVNNENPKNLSDIVTSLLASYTYTVEIKTATKSQQFYTEGVPTIANINGRYFEMEEDGDYKAEITKEQYEKRKKEIKEKKEPTEYYSNLTVPGGTNYTENEIRTPDIIPSIKGHAQFSTDQGIGWFRSDESESDLKGFRKINNNGLVSTEYLGKSTKTRRILEVQSDLFQKGRDNKRLVGERGQLDETYDEALQALKEAVERGDWTQQEADEEIKRLNKEKDSKENQFLQLLNKDNNWATFFVKSIIQDSAKKGYEKILFPTGNTASKVEDSTLEEFKKERKDRINDLESLVNRAKNKNYDTTDKIFLKDEGEYLQKVIFKNEIEPFYFYNNYGYEEKISKEEFNKKIEDNIKRIEDTYVEINQLKQELERIEKEGFGALKPIHKFYEETIKNILNKNYKVENITDEYGNTWYQIEPSLVDIQLSKRKEKQKPSNFKKQNIFYKRRLAQLEKKKSQWKGKKGIEYNKLIEEIDSIKDVLESDSRESYFEAGNETLNKVEDYLNRALSGEKLKDKHIIFVSDVLDAFKEFRGLMDKTTQLEEKLFPIIQEHYRDYIKEFSTEKEEITQEKIDKQNEDIGKFKLYTGALADSTNYITRTIGNIIKKAQNTKSIRDKDLKEQLETERELLSAWSKKNGVSLEKTLELFIQPRKNTTGLTQKYYENEEVNPNWTKIQNTPELKRFYNFYQSKMAELESNQAIKLGIDGIPNIKKETTWDKIKDLVPVHETKLEDFSGNEDLYADILPTKYLKKLESSKKSNDLFVVLMTYGKYIHNHEEMTKILPKVRILQKGLKYKLQDGEIVKREFKGSSDPKTSVYGEDSNLNKMIEGYITMQIFGENKKAELKSFETDIRDEKGNVIGQKYILGSDIADLLLKYNSLLRIGFSPITAASNWLFGDVSNFIEGVGNQFYSLSNLQQASNIFIKQNFDENSVLNKELINNLNILQDLEDYNQVTDVSLKEVKKLSPEKLQEYAYSMQKAGEKWLQTRTAMAVMIKDGYLTPTGELTEKYKNSTEKEKTALVDKIQRLNQMIHGRYTQQEAAIASQFVLYRLVSQFKKWIPSYIESHFDKLHYDNRLQTEIEGRFRTLGRLTGVNNTISNLTQLKFKEALLSIPKALKDTINRLNKGKLTKSEIYNMKKNLVEITLMLATIFAYGAIHGDKDKNKNRRKNWAIKTGLTLLNRVSGDISFFYSPTQIANTAKNIVPLVKTFDDLRLAVTYLPYVFDEKKGIYQKGSNKGRNKFLTKLGNITVGVKPINDIRRLANKQLLEELN